MNDIIAFRRYARAYALVMHGSPEQIDAHGDQASITEVMHNIKELASRDE